MSSEDNGFDGKNRRHRVYPHISIGNILTMLAIAGGAVGVYAQTQTKIETQANRIEQIEKREAANKQEEKDQRKEVKDDIKEVKQEVKELRQDVQKVLQEVVKQNRRSQ